MLFPEIPVLCDMADRVGNQLQGRLQRTIFVCVQHLLETTGSLFETLIRMGANPHLIHVMGKWYSTNEGVKGRLGRLGIAVRDIQPTQRPGYYQDVLTEGVKALWKQVEKQPLAYRTDHQIIVIDDGGQCIMAIPSQLHRPIKNIVAIEQTTSGLRQPGERQCPVIEVASSATKRLIEPPMIADAVVRRLRMFLPRQNRTSSVGIIGLGYIGRAVARTLLNDGCRVHVYDTAKVPPPEGSNPIFEIHDLFQRSDIILGCTGVDVIEHPQHLLNKLRGSKTLVSCSSGDREFRSLLTYAGQGRRTNRDPLGMVPLRNESGTAELKILRGGFPFNFDGSHESVPAHDIQLTRGLLLSAVIQGIVCQQPEREGLELREMLDPSAQRFVVDSWVLRRKPSPDLLSRMPSLDLFQDNSWVIQASGGKPLCCPKMSELFTTLRGGIG